MARPIFSRQVSVLYYAIRHPDTGDWLTNTYQVRGGEKRLAEGWEYTFEYPALGEQPEFHPEQPLLLMLAVPASGRRRAPRLLCPDSRPPAQGVVGQGAGRPGPGPLGAGRRQMGGPGGPRDPVRRVRGRVPDGHRQLRGRVADYGRHPHRNPSGPDLRPPLRAAGVVGGVGRHHRRPDRDPGLDGPELHRPGAPGPPSIGLAGRWCPVWCWA